MSSSAEVELAIRKALEEAEAKREAKDKEVGVGDIIGAGCASFIPGLGLIIGLIHLAKGRTNKGLLYLGLAVGLVVMATLFMFIFS